MFLKRVLTILIFFFCLCSYAQDEIVANEYFKNGEFEKALSSYKRLFKDKPNNTNYLLKIVEIEQELELYKEAEQRLIKALQTSKSPNLLVELGYNYQLQKDTINANKNYQKAIATLEQRPTNAYSIGRVFQNHSLLEEAIQAYTKAMQLQPSLNFNLQLARIYGEQSNIEKMFDSYLNFISANPTYLDTIKRYISEFITEDSDNEGNIILRKTLLKKIQQNPDLMWNEMLSWLFIQQKDYNKAFAQEKAIYKRQQESLDRVIELGFIAKNNKDYEMAISIFEYVVETSQEISTKLEAQLKIIELKTEIALPKDYNDIEKSYTSILEQYGKTPQTLNIQKSYAHFLAFYLEQPEEAISILKNTLKYNIPEIYLAEVKLELGDILVFQEKFNQALIYYTQIQRNLKNSPISQEARFRVAKASYYKGDFKWAESQLKILKASTSQLTANDALDLKLLISDNRAEDSTQTALKKYAKADLLAFQNKNKPAIAILNDILKAHKTEVIVPQTLLKQAELFEKEHDYDSAKANYLRIIKDFKDSILLDNALYNLAELLNNTYNQPEEAKPYYETILFDHPDSIFYVEARKKFRKLRGDDIN